MTADPTTAAHKVLVVDDEEDVREGLRELLEEEGFAVEVAGDGRQALNVLARLRPCVIILDILMPGMNGDEVYEAMQTDPALAGIPVIVSTSDSTRAPSGVLLMKKPINVQRLLQAVTSLCPRAA